ncbi:alpha/beta fold hydrolase [Maridesulfovibrio sp.]|uniref:alpha/beta hydrolase family protein n=1 Tax=Maridesulfovibrio sp. TaxID=2795000 RepID=UPI0029F4C2BD|nr:alpha/beta fold hydrolase [Maridesulfovibrio sp.]
MKVVRLFCMACCLMLCPLAAQAAPHLFNVGLRQLSVPYPPTTSNILGSIWFPTAEEPHSIAMGPYKLNVAKDASIQDGKHRLVVISHGSGGSHLGHRDTAMFLAQHGDIVVSVLHPQNNFLDNSAEGTSANWINRPQHITRVLDFLLTSSRYAQYIDADRIAVLGHSAGGYTAMALAGGVPDLSILEAHCREHGEDVLCGSPDSQSLSRITNLPTPQAPATNQRLDNLYDPRIKAAILMAPVGVFFNYDGALNAVSVPICIFRAEKDNFLHYPYHAEAIRQHLHVPCEYMVVPNAGHYSFLTPFPPEAAARAGTVAEDPPGFDRARFHSRLNERIYTFLSRTLD